MALNLKYLLSKLVGPFWLHYVNLDSHQSKYNLFSYTQSLYQLWEHQFRHYKAKNAMLYGFNGLSTKTNISSNHIGRLTILKNWWPGNWYWYIHPIDNTIRMWYYGTLPTTPTMATSGSAKRAYFTAYSPFAAKASTSGAVNSDIVLPSTDVVRARMVAFASCSNSNVMGTSVNISGSTFNINFATLIKSSSSTVISDTPYISIYIIYFTGNIDNTDVTNGAQGSFDRGTLLDD